MPVANGAGTKHETVRSFRNLSNSTNANSEIQLLSLCCFSHSSSMWPGGAWEICGDVDLGVCSLLPFSY